ncbi:MAG TPA: hypothetical protein VEZ11_18940 [Thermoanaerobaculia bacterium]|nr:hypothetical protein [Thermoanaerobaculia bacterium]
MVRVKRLLLVFLAPLLIAASCYPPSIVTNDLTLDFRDGADPHATAVTTLPSNVDQNAGMPVENRLHDLREALASERDEWSLRFAGVSAGDEQVVWDKREGRLWRVQRSATIPHDRLQRLFNDTAVTVSVVDGEGWRELLLSPGGSARATREQRESFGRALDVWSEAMVRYVAAMRHFHAYLDRNPTRASSCWAYMLSDMATNDLPDQVTPVTSDEQAMLDEAGDAMSAVTDIVRLGENQAFSLNEVADLVFNPFPAAITVRVPGQVLEREGFTEAGEGVLKIRRADLVEGISSLDRRWVAPDPLAIYVRTLRPGEKPDPVSLASIVGEKRSVATMVTASEIRAAAEATLRPAPSYRVRWVVTSRDSAPR